MTIAADCMNEFNAHNMDTIGLTQQVNFVLCVFEFDVETNKASDILFRTLLVVKHQMAVVSSILRKRCYLFWTIRILGNVTENRINRLGIGAFSKFYMIAHHPIIVCSQYDKTRLLMLWIASSEGQVDEEKKQNLLAHARLDQEYKDAIDNLSLLGVQLSKSANKQGEKSKKEKKKQDSSQEVPFDLSRYVPVVKRVSEVSTIW